MTANLETAAPARAGAPGGDDDLRRVLFTWRSLHRATKRRRIIFPSPSSKWHFTASRIWARKVSIDSLRQKIECSRARAVTPFCRFFDDEMISFISIRVLTPAYSPKCSSPRHGGFVHPASTANSPVEENVCIGATPRCRRGAWLIARGFTATERRRYNCGRHGRHYRFFSGAGPRIGEWRKRRGGADRSCVGRVRRCHARNCPVI